MNRDEALRATAARQHGLVGWRQARDLGFTRDALRHRLTRGEWVLVTPRVLGVRGAPSDVHRQLLAAVLDSGGGAVVGRWAAAALWELPGFPAGPVELSRQRGSSGRRPTTGRLFEVRYLPPHLTDTVRGVPVVSLPYLLFQLAGLLKPPRLERVVDTVVTRSPATLGTLHRLLPELAEHGRNGIVAMRQLLDDRPPGTRVVASGLEARFERILREAGQGPLDRQVDVGGHEWLGRVDFVDRQITVVFEVDSQTHHTSVLDRSRDEARDVALLRSGFRAVRRIPEEWIWHDPERAVAAVRDTRRHFRVAVPAAI